MSRSVFFHMSNVEHGDEVVVGDQVKFQLSFSQRAQKHSASHVSRLYGNKSNKPGWLIRKGSSNSLPSMEFRYVSMHVYKLIISPVTITA